MLYSSIFLFVGLVLLISGANWFVKGASSLARKYGVSELMIGLTIVAFGTSAPEMVINILAALEGHQDMVFGNIIGSNNFNLFVILGLAGLIYPLKVQHSTVWTEIPVSGFAAFFLLILSNDYFNESSILSRLDGVLLLGMFTFFLFYLLKQLNTPSKKKKQTEEHVPFYKTWGFIILGVTGLIIGGRMVTNSATEIARLFGISERIVGLTIVAAGTSLPEFATSLVAAFKKSMDIAVGNIIGSNIFNILLILAVSAVIVPIDFDQVFNLDLYVLMGGTLLLFLAMFSGGERTLDRWEGVLLLVLYIAYITFILW